MKFVQKSLIGLAAIVILVNIFSSHVYVRSFSVVSLSLFALGFVYSSRNKKSDFKGEEFDALIAQIKQGKKPETKDHTIQQFSDYILNQFDENKVLISENEKLKRSLNELRSENQMLQERFGFSGHIESQNKLSFEKIGKAIQYSLQTFENNIAASNEIYTSSLNIASAIQTQYGQSEQIAGSVEEMSQNLQQTSTHTKTANDTSKHAADKALNGVKIAYDVKAGIEKVEEKSNRTKNTVEGLVKEMEQIGNVAQVIDDIADQTNLLALNAAIEAARAGEQGRGFAVVADEVRKLAERTAKATKEIAKIVKSLQGEVKYASEAMEDVDKEIKNELTLTTELTGSLKEIENETLAITDLISQITHSCSEQSEAMDTISQSILKLHTSIEEVNMASKSISSDTKQSNNDASRNYDKMLISVAKSDHINWVNNIVDTVVRHKEIDLNSVTNHLNCRFGKWYYSSAQERYSHLPVYRQLEPIHIAVHSKGKELLENCRNKKVEDAQKCVAEIEGLRDTILGLLDELERLV